MPMLWVMFSAASSMARMAFLAVAFSHMRHGRQAAREDWGRYLLWPCAERLRQGGRRGGGPMAGLQPPMMMFRRRRGPGLLRAGLGAAVQAAAVGQGTRPGACPWPPWDRLEALEPPSRAVRRRGCCWPASGPPPFDGWEDSTAVKAKASGPEARP